MDAVPGSRGRRIRADHSLSQIRHLQPLIADESLHALEHRPIVEQRARVVVAAEPPVDLLARGRRVEPEVAIVRGTQRVAQPATSRRASPSSPSHRPARVSRMSASHFSSSFQSCTLEPSSNGTNMPPAAGIQSKPCPSKSSSSITLGCSNPHDVRARREPHAGPRLLHGARAAHALARLEHQHAFARAREIRGAGETVVPRPHDHHIPRSFRERRRSAREVPCGRARPRLSERQRIRSVLRHGRKVTKWSSDVRKATTRNGKFDSSGQCL